MEYSSNLTTVAQRLQYIIDSKGFKSNKQFCETIGITEVTLSNIMTAKTKTVSGDLLGRLLDLWDDVDTNWILRGKEKKSFYELENEKLKNENSFLSRKLRGVLKPLSSRLNSQAQIQLKMAGMGV